MPVWNDAQRRFTHTCALATCPAQASGVGCPCNAGFQGTPLWAVGDTTTNGRWTHSCAAITCTAPGAIVGYTHGCTTSGNLCNTNVACANGFRRVSTPTLTCTSSGWTGAGCASTCPTGGVRNAQTQLCQCGNGFTGTLTWVAASQTYTGSCTAASCPSGGSGATCPCPQGFLGNQVWDGTKWVSTGCTNVAPCPSGASGAGCRCTSNANVNPVWVPGTGWTHTCTCTDTFSAAYCAGEKAKGNCADNEIIQRCGCTCAASGGNNAPTFNRLNNGVLCLAPGLASYNTQVLQAVSAGEVGQTVTSTGCTTTNSGLFTTQPTLVLTGTVANLAFASSAASGTSATVTCNLRDNGSPAQTTPVVFTVNFRTGGVGCTTGTNNAPTFIRTSNGLVCVAPGLASYNTQVLQAVSAGEVGQIVTSTGCTTSNSGLFTTQPRLVLSGSTANLMFASTAPTGTTATVTCNLRDNGSPQRIVSPSFTVNFRTGGVGCSAVSNLPPTFTRLNNGITCVTPGQNQYTQQVLSTLSAGEAGQIVTSTGCTATNSALFTTQPTLVIVGTIANLVFTSSSALGTSTTVNCGLRDNGSPSQTSNALFTVNFGTTSAGCVTGGNTAPCSPNAVCQFVNNVNRVSVPLSGVYSQQLLTNLNPGLESLQTVTVTCTANPASAFAVQPTVVRTAGTNSGILSFTAAGVAQTATIDCLARDNAAVPLSTAFKFFVAVGGAVVPPPTTVDLILRVASRRAFGSFSLSLFGNTMELLLKPQFQALGRTLAGITVYYVCPFAACNNNINGCPVSTADKEARGCRRGDTYSGTARGFELLQTTLNQGAFVDFDIRTNAPSAAQLQVDRQTASQFISTDVQKCASGSACTLQPLTPDTQQPVQLVSKPVVQVDDDDDDWAWWHWLLLALGILLFLLLCCLLIWCLCLRDKKPKEKTIVEEREMAPQETSYVERDTYDYTSRGSEDYYSSYDPNSYATEEVLVCRVFLLTCLTHSPHTGVCRQRACAGAVH